MDSGMPRNFRMGVRIQAITKLLHKSMIALILINHYAAFCA